MTKTNVASQNNLALVENKIMLFWKILDLGQRWWGSLKCPMFMKKGELIDVCGLHYKAASIIAENSVLTKDRRKVWILGGGEANSNVVGIICPLVDMVNLYTKIWRGHAPAPMAPTDLQQRGRGQLIIDWLLFWLNNPRRVLERVGITSFLKSLVVIKWPWAI